MEQKYKDHVCLHPMSELDPVEKVLFDLKDLLGEDFLVINSDTFIMKNKVIEFINSSKVDTGSVCLGVSMQDNVVGKSLIKVVDGRVEIFIEKPTTPSRGHSYSGIMLLNRDTVDISKDFMSEMIPSLVGKMSAIDVGEIVDIGGSIPAYLKACDHIREMEKI